MSSARDRALPRWRSPVSVPVASRGTAAARGDAVHTRFRRSRTGGWRRVADDELRDAAAADVWQGNVRALLLSVQPEDVEAAARQPCAERVSVEHAAAVLRYGDSWSARRYRCECIQRARVVSGAAT